MLATNRWSAYLARKTCLSSSTHRASISSIYWVPANQRFTGPICPSAARMPTSAERSALTVGLVGASGASRFRHRLLHLLGRATGVQKGPGIGKDVRVMHFELLRWVLNITHGWSPFVT